MKYWFKNVADNIYIYPKSAPRNLILQIRTSDCNSANPEIGYQLYRKYVDGKIKNKEEFLKNLKEMEEKRND